VAQCRCRQSDTVAVATGDFFHSTEKESNMASNQKSGGSKQGSSSGGNKQSGNQGSRSGGSSGGTQGGTHEQQFSLSCGCSAW